jgi:5-methylcytosine-specific restriction endonuclease McrA
MQTLGVRWDRNNYCIECLPKVRNEHTYTCRHCKVEFLSRRQVILCEQCRMSDWKTQSRVIQVHKQKSKQAGLPATLTLEQWLHTLRYFHGKCAYCQEQTYEELDHFIPTDAGGGTTARNCVPACKACNNTKSNFNPVDPPLRFKTNAIDWFLMPKKMDVPLLEQIKRVAAYLGAPFPYNTNLHF